LANSDNRPTILTLWATKPIRPLIEAAGFVAMGERESRLPDGSVRLSRYWELTREQWRALHAAAP